MATGFQVIPLNTPGAAGLDRRSDLSDVVALACRQLRNIDVWPGRNGQGSRVLPRRPLRRWGRRILLVMATGEGAGTFTGTFKYKYRYSDANGMIHVSDIFSRTVANVDHIKVYAWPSGIAGTTVSIYRTIDGGNTPKLVVADYDAELNDHYDDSTADGGLGAEIPADPVGPDPLGNDDFNQSALCDFLTIYRSKSDERRTLGALVRTGGIESVGKFAYGYPDGDSPVFAAEDIYQTAGTTSMLTEPGDFALLGDLLWLARGYDALYYRDVEQSSGFKKAEQPGRPTLSSPSQSAGTLDANTGHTYVVQFRHKKTGIRGLPSDPLEFAGPYTNQKNSFNISTTPTGCEREIFRTSDGGQFYQYLGTTLGLGDETPDCELSQETVSFAVGAADGFKYVWAHKGILFVAHQVKYGSDVDAEPNLVRWSSEKPFNFPNDPFINEDYQRQIDQADGDEITSGCSWGEVCLIFKRHKVYMLTGDPPSGFRWAPVPGSRGLGCVAHRTIVETDAGLMWLSPVGLCVMSQPGAPPMVVSDPISEIFVEVERQSALAADAAMRVDPPGFSFKHLCDAAQTLHFQLQLDTTDFLSPDFDWATNDGGERPYFRLNGGHFPSSGVVARNGRRLGLAVELPAAGGPTAGTTYHVRYHKGAKLVGFPVTWDTSWTALDDYTPPADDPVESVANWERIAWAFAVHYPSRKEVWLALPTGDRPWCDQIYVLNYEAISLGGAPLWRGPLMIACTAGTLVSALEVNSQPKQDYVLLAGPDGVLFITPWLYDPLDCDTHVSIDEDDRVVSATLSGGTTLTADGTSWPTSQYGLKANVVVVRDGDGQSYTALITANTGTTLTVVWLGGRQPANGTVTIEIGGLDARIETGWLPLAGGGETAILRTVVVHSGAARAAVHVQAHAGRGATRNTRELPAASATIPVGRGFQQSRAELDLRGHVHRLALGSMEAGALWEVNRLDLEIEPTGSTE